MKISLSEKPTVATVRQTNNSLYLRHAAKRLQRRHATCPKPSLSQQESLFRSPAKQLTPAYVRWDVCRSALPQVLLNRSLSLITAAKNGSNGLRGGGR